MEMSEARDSAIPRRFPWALGLVPSGLLFAAALALPGEAIVPSNGQQRGFEPAARFRTVVLILDSAGEKEMFDPDLMPFLTSLRSSALSGRSRSCEAKATFPCIKSIFEGRVATMGTTLQDFSAFASTHTTWPGSLASRGTRLVVASDHTLNRLYPNAFVDSLNYEDLHVPLLERDAFVYRKARQWLDDASIDGLILHIVGTDKVSHEFPVRGPVYREKYREVDDFIREVAGRLRPADYLFAISDHGHNDLGGHTEDAGYLARGPLFPNRVRANLDAEDMLFLLSLPYGLILPADYQGQIRLDLTQLPDDLRKRWLATQADAWRVPIAGLALEAAQARLNEEIIHRNEDLERASAFQTAWRSAPFWLAGALFLMAQLRHRQGDRASRRRFFQVALVALGLALVSMGITGAAWLITAAAFVYCLEQLGPRTALLGLLGIVVFGAFLFWVFPAGLTWIHDEIHRAVAYIVFYLAAIAVGLVRARSVALQSRRDRLLEILWTIGIAVWLFAYFGPLGYSLHRHGSLIVLGVFPLVAIVLAAGWRTLLSPPALFLPGLIPIIWSDVESYNLKFLVVDRIPQLPPAFQFVLAGLAAILFVVALSQGQRRAAFLGSLFVLGWLGFGLAFFQFDISKLAGGLFGCLWLSGCLSLFRRANLPLRWFALVAAVFLFILLTFFLNGFALSHVDFRFAADRIFPFAREVWRAPQLIIWAMVKYAFALGPAFVVICRAGEPRRLLPQLLVLGWWRELGIVAGALGLALFNTRGMRELCSEEIYFWTFLNLVLFLLYLAFWRLRRPEPDALAEAQ